MDENEECNFGWKQALNGKAASIEGVTVPPRPRSKPGNGAPAADHADIWYFIRLAVAVGVWLLLLVGIWSGNTALAFVPGLR
jgi:hypothetical protein